MNVHGTVRPPGDKSISHRVLLFGALARAGAESEFTGMLTGEDVKSTARVMRQLGAEISPIRDAAKVIVRASRFSAPAARLNCGNSGTTARLILGVLAGQRFAATLTGDASLRRRPMRRVTDPLRSMGARIENPSADTLPLTIRGGQLHSLEYTLPIASAQVKSALLLAALTGHVPITLREPFRSRDHTERLLLHLGLDISERDGAIVFQPSSTALPALRVPIAGDPSSAAFLVAVAALAQSGELLVENVGVNPTRTGFLVVLERMGVTVERLNLRDVAGEPVADLLVRPATRILATEVRAAEIPTLVDEVPVLAAVASRAGSGAETIFREVGELRVKESNRLELVARNLRALGVEAEAIGDDLHVRGSDRPPRGTVLTERDHRIAMAFAVLGTLPHADVRLSERRSVAISYPAFFADLKRIGRNARHRG